MKLTQELLKEWFEYKSDTGELVWKIQRRGRGQKGSILGTQTLNYRPQERYKRCGLLNKHYGLHQIVFMWHYGRIPKIIDHIDRDTTNNRIENLREATSSLNNRNRNTYGNSNHKGVYLYTRNGKWAAQIVKPDGTLQPLGRYETEVEADAMYKAAFDLYYTVDYQEREATQDSA